MAARTSSPQTSPDIAEALRGLLAACRDSEDGYRLAARRAPDVEVRTAFLRRAWQRVRFATELGEELRRQGQGWQGPERTRRRSGVGALRRGWLGARATLRRGDSRIVLAECERRERALLVACEAVMVEELPSHLTPVLELHWGDVFEAYTRFRWHREDAARRGDDAPSDASLRFFVSGAISR
jgi:uncharacterized protein (TIGR02284 family)